MDSSGLGQITKLLSQGDAAALVHVFPLIYQELRELAARHLANARSGHTLQPTAVVHELYLRLADSGGDEWKSRAQFFFVASTCIRNILIDHARRRGAAKRGGDRQRVTLDTPIDAIAAGPIDLLDLDEAMGKLALVDKRRAQIAELRLFGGLNGDEIAEAMGLSRTSIATEWRFARAWLSRALAGDTVA